MTQGKRLNLCVKNILDKYSINILSLAYKNLNDIYWHISTELQAENSALNLIDKLEEAIYSLELMPQRGAKRRAGAYANKGYRQIFVENFTIVYRINELKKQILIITVKYSQSKF